MKIMIYTTALAMWLGTTVAINAQENQDQKVEDTIEILTNKKDVAIQEEKEALRKEVETINKKLEAKSISAEEAAKLKSKAAEKRALNIENRLAILDNQIDFLERNRKEIGKDASPTGTAIILGIGQEDMDEDVVFGVKVRKRNPKNPFDRRTTSHLNMAVGLNNVITQGESFNDSEFKIGGSRFFELGYSFKTRVFKNSNWLRVKYGLSFQFNGLKPIDNQYFVENGNQTELQTFPLDLKKSKFRMDNLVIPVFFEFGPSKKNDFGDYFRYSTYRKISVGLGGYAGLNLSTRQKLRYKEDGRRRKDKIKESYNTSNLVYGLSGYISWKEVGLYAKYDLNPIFKDNPVAQRNISVGLRYDWN